MSKPPGVLTQQQIKSACAAGLSAGAGKVTVEAVTPNGTRLTVTAHAEAAKRVMHRGGRRAAPSDSAPNEALGR